MAKECQGGGMYCASCQGCGPDTNWNDERGANNEHENAEADKSDNKPKKKKKNP